MTSIKKAVAKRTPTKKAVANPQTTPAVPVTYVAIISALDTRGPVEIGMAPPEATIRAEVPRGGRCAAIVSRRLRPSRRSLGRRVFGVAG
jgi:hypothetical protein